MTPLVDDPALIARVLAGEREAFHVLVERHNAALLATLRASLTRDDAHDVLQETWLRAFRDLRRLREPTRLRAWLLSIALNQARARARRPAPLSLDGLARDPTGPEPGEDAPGDELGALRRRLEELPARQREVLDLRVNHGLSHAEIAAALGIREEASRASHYQALKRLKQALARGGKG